MSWANEQIATLNRKAEQAEERLTAAEEKLEKLIEAVHAFAASIAGNPKDYRELRDMCEAAYRLTSALSEIDE